MLTLFKSKPLLAEQEQQWLVDTFIWAAENFDLDFFTKHSQVILPTVEFFPDSVSSIEEMASKVFARVKQYAGMNEWPVTLVAPQQLQPQVFPHFEFSQHLRGEECHLIVPASHTINVSFNPNQINQPQDLVASFAGTLATILIHHVGVLPPGGKEYLPQATDALACFLGFGVMMSNTVYQFKGGCGSCYNPYANREAALSETHTVFMHALVSYFKQDKHSKKHLKPHLRGQFKKAQKEIKALVNQSANPLLLAFSPEQAS
ncbi:MULTISPECIES: hypothetical protein [Pseudoalteromonas]|jgi:hypothetical protein|uniref:Orphan protein n=4 Tax=Pseudoalteromonas TaxID=53246 RepID=A0A9W4R224_PSEHA|nr:MULTISPECIES: hypothetical protein [Pseudoalteromonas]ADT69669.1 hypothetical protein PSM_A2756 [Pseudoalteromonas sp. SM9913]ATC91843.1 hypothetical protein PISS_a3125 [Pseudoalteromonas issachenkonii]ATD04388.1 hypothetical protein PTET_a3154 [Pseudoalteromonas tetraodonis]KYL31602.1 hypothetical protein A2I96_03565 [Pseudoalteromonas spiralis]MDN3434533.1 hypothetical protein [Pseudoalteromonas sp. APC 3356]|tara:strand:+ start:55 stop:837 length:783 start_codon:yes stop_codon:yes gene_type:complete